MAKVYIQAQTLLYVPDKHGKLVAHHPGDWVKVGKARAREWIASGQATLPDLDQEREVLIGNLKDCGIVVRNGYINQAAMLVEKHEFKVRMGSLELPFKRTLLWSPDLALTERQATLGFSRIEEAPRGDGWEIAVMLQGNRMLASQIGSVLEQEKTTAAVGDLRLPVYDVNALWIRNTANSRRVMKAWKAELEESTDEAHSFLRAIYTSPVLLCTLPHQWLRKWRTV